MGRLASCPGWHGLDGMVIMAKPAKHQEVFTECLDICHSVALFFLHLVRMWSSLESKSDSSFCLFISVDAVPCSFPMNTCLLGRLKVATGEVGAMRVVGPIPFDSRQGLPVPCAVLCVGNDLVQ